jgi:hypothetical protein
LNYFVFISNNNSYYIGDEAVESRKMATIGNIEPFNQDTDDWSHYAERLQFFFEANDIEEDSKKRASLLTIAGADTFKTIRSLLAPSKPSEKTYDEIVQALTNHFSPKRSQVLCRSKFYQCEKKPEDSVSTYLSELRTLASDCYFGDKLDEMIRDRLVCGLNDPVIQKRLLTEGDGLTLERAITLAQALESAVKDAQALQVHVPVGPQHVFNVTPPKSSFKVRQRADRQTATCYRCGRIGHNPENCRFKNEICYNCRKVGHISSVCRSKGKGKPSNIRAIEAAHVEEENVEDDEYSALMLNNISSVSSNRPIVISVSVDQCPLNMELDTGAAVSLVSEETFKKCWPNRSLETPFTKLTTYSGEELTVQGVVHVVVEHNNCHATLPLWVVAGNGPSLLGREWLYESKINWQDILRVHSVSLSLHDLLKKHEVLFEEGLGTLKGFQAKIHTDPNVPPKFCKARPIPYAYREKVEIELNRLLELGIIESIQFSDWAAPIVPVLKSDRNIRICGDYSLTVNKASKLERYPIPKLDDLLTTLAGGENFSKLDLSQAYQQVELEESSKQYCVINTHKGLFKYNRLPFGVSSAPAIFQRVMENLLLGMANLAVYFDDIIVTGRDTTEHLSTLETVLSRLQESGLRLKKNKCKFLVPSVSFLGYLIDKHGIHPSPEKLRAIRDAPHPQNVTELKSYLGLLSYYNRFMPHLPTVLFPLYRLLHQDTVWHWKNEEEMAFTKSKEIITSDSVLVHFDPSLDLILACDASSYGIGAVLAHKLPNGTERPIAFASRTLSDTEKKYAQIEKEGLACVYGVKKFHSFVYGRHFTMVTDHKPLLTLFDGNRAVSPQSSARIQRWALTLASYSFNLQCKSSRENANADALSRLPLQETVAETPVPPELVLLLEHIANSPVTSEQIREWTAKDKVLSLVLQYLRSGSWPDSCPSDELKPYWTRQTELSLVNGCILWASRVVVPVNGRSQLLNELHEGHFGISKAKSRARSCIWWPGIDKQIETMIKNCHECQQTRGTPPEAPSYPWPWPLDPWTRLHIDFAGPINNIMLLIVIDAHSKWIEVFSMKTASSFTTIQHLQTLFAQFGLPKTIVSDNASYFVSQEFKAFLTKNGIKHITSAPYHPATNGLAERAVQIVKNGLKRDSEGTLCSRLARILFNYRVTPHCTTNSSPAELLFGRNLRVVSPTIVAGEIVN